MAASLASSRTVRPSCSRGIATYRSFAILWIDAVDANAMAERARRACHVTLEQDNSVSQEPYALEMSSANILSFSCISASVLRMLTEVKGRREEIWVTFCTLRTRGAGKVVAGEERRDGTDPSGPACRRSSSSYSSSGARLSDDAGTHGTQE